MALNCPLCKGPFKVGSTSSPPPVVPTQPHVAVPGQWFSRAAGSREAHWTEVGRTPGVITFDPSLEYKLVLGESATDEDLAALAGANSAFRLDALEVHCSITDEGVQHLSRLSGLKSLSLGCENVTDRGLAALARLHRLERLTLPSCIEITDTGFSALKALGNLRHLSLAGIFRMTDAGLAELCSLTALEKLDLLGCEAISPQGFGCLADLVALRELILSPCRDAWIDSLPARMPRCTIQNIEPSERPTLETESKVPTQAQQPLVACSKCAAGISDVAESCPRCGHPQPIQELAKGAKGGTCSFCSTVNVFYFGQGAKCRGCARPLDEIFEAERRLAGALSAYKSANLHIEMLAHGPIGLALIALCVVVKFDNFFNLPLLPALLALVLLTLFVVWSVTAAVVQALVRRSRQVTAEDWAEGVREYLKTHTKFSERWPGLKRWLIGVAVGTVLCCLGGVLNLNTKSDQERRKAEEASALLLVRAECHVAATLVSGLLSSDLQLTNKDGLGFPVKDVTVGVGPCALSRCDLTILVFFDTGTRLSLKRYWERWAIGETKTVNFTPQGKVERVEVSGTVHDAEGKVKGDTKMSFLFGR